ncbi:MAG: sulfatase-like hydrolase/transferase [Proteobacteria bacterium]|nr:sulfatase-like hydrolase/transferase [Pseudomonadota bacterium]MBU1419067.1 sulfatase-like hydrolase/transferase [Pseudomonadota bacterium]MBU1456269.1 sulfatase-like hydrolase/transferase [Pseudomonadota bacterium]
MKNDIPAFAGTFFKVGRFIPLYWLGLFYLLVSFLLRLVLFVAFGPPATVPLWHLPPVLGLGLINDMIQLLYLLTPLSLYLLLTPQRIYNSFPGRLIVRMAMWLVIFGMLYLTAVQFFFFQEYDARFNLVAVDYLIYPHEVFVNIWQSYPVGRVLIVMATLSSLIMLFLWKVIENSMAEKTLFTQRLRIVAVHVALLGIAVIGFRTHSLDFSDNRVTNELSANGLSSLFQAFHTNNLDYNYYYITGDQQSAIERLTKQLGAGGGSFKKQGEDWLTRSFAGRANGLGELNVVVIVEESLGCEHVDSCGKGLDIDSALAENGGSRTPFLDNLARQGLFFNRAYATGTRTVRGLEAISASFPPIPSESIIKRPGNDNIATWGQVMRKNGYHTSFLYGGYGQFDNMNSFFAENAFAISDRLDIEEPEFTNIWGVSDQDLFRHALGYFDNLSGSGKPFFSIIMTTSNHSPYTFPSGIEGIPAKDGGRTAGVRYADYALGEFFEKAAAHSWYANTLFVVVADHGARVYGKEQIPMSSYEIPLLIMAPGHIQPRQINTPVSQIDIAPTVLGLLGLSYEAPFFGQDVLAHNDASRILLLNHNHDVALYRDEQLVVLGLRNSVKTYNYLLGSSKFNDIANNRDLTELAVSYYQNAFNLFREHMYR